MSGLLPYLPVLSSYALWKREEGCEHLFKNASATGRLQFARKRLDSTKQGRFRADCVQLAAGALVAFGSQWALWGLAIAGWALLHCLASYACYRRMVNWQKTALDELQKPLKDQAGQMRALICPLSRANESMIFRHLAGQEAAFLHTRVDQLKQDIGELITPTSGQVKEWSEKLKAAELPEVAAEIDAFYECIDKLGQWIEFYQAVPSVKLTIWNTAHERLIGPSDPKEADDMQTLGKAIGSRGAENVSNELFNPCVIRILTKTSSTVGRILSKLDAWIQEQHNQQT